MEIRAVLQDVSGFIEQVVRKSFCYLLLLLISCAARDISATQIFANAEWGKWLRETSSGRTCWADSDSYHKQSDVLKSSCPDLQPVWRWKQQTLQFRTRYRNPCFWRGLVTARRHGNGAGDAGCYAVSWVTSSAHVMVKLLSMSQCEDEFSCCSWWMMMSLLLTRAKSFICNITIYFTRVVHRAWTKIHPSLVSPLILRGELGCLSDDGHFYTLVLKETLQFQLCVWSKPRSNIFGVRFPPSDDHFQCK